MGRVYLVPVKILYDAKGVQRLGLRVASVYIEFIHEPEIPLMTTQVGKLFGSRVNDTYLLWDGIEKPKSGIKYARLEGIQDYTWEQLNKKLCRLRTISGEQCASFLLGAPLEKEKYNTCDINPIIFTGCDINYNHIADMSEAEYNLNMGHIYLLNSDGAFLELAVQPYSQRTKRWSYKVPVTLTPADSKIVVSSTSSAAWIEKLSKDLAAQPILYAYSKGKQVATKSWCISIDGTRKVVNLPLHCIQTDALKKDMLLKELAADASSNYETFYGVAYQVALEKFATTPKVLIAPKNIEEYRVFAPLGYTNYALPKVQFQEPIKQLRVYNCARVNASACTQGYGRYWVDTTDAEKGTYIADAPITLDSSLVSPTYKVVTWRFVPPTENWVLPELFTNETRNVLSSFELIIAEPIAPPAIMVPMANADILLSICNKSPAVMLGFDTRAIKKARQARISLMLQSNAIVVLNLQGAHIGQLYVDISMPANVITQGAGVMQSLRIINGSVTTLNVTTNVIIQQVQVDAACKKVNLAGKKCSIHSFAKYSSASTWTTQTEGYAKANVVSLQLKRAAVLTLNRVGTVNVIAEVAPKEIAATEDTKCTIKAEKGIVPEVGLLRTPYYDF